MGRGPTKSNENVYFVARKKAAMYNERLYSREGAAELLGISVSTLADYELGNTKVVPVDKVVLMADLYNAPELKTGYCKYECPICSYLPVTVYGEPKGKGRPRFNTKTGHAITPKDTVSYENLVKLEWQTAYGTESFPKEAMLDMRIKAYYRIPKSASKKKRAAMLAGEIRPTKKPDMDNVVKIIADSLNNLAYYDDTQIVDCQCRKFYSENPRVEVTIINLSKEE